MNFLNNKRNVLGKKDKSNEQGIDKRINKLCKKINDKKEYYTTSSCAGRINLVKGLQDKAEDVFLFKSHEKINFLRLKKELIKAGKYKGLIYFKQEPCILHVACLDLESAKKLLNKARDVGWMRSGLISDKKIILELISTEKLELPIMNNGKLLVNENYLKLLAKESNKRLKRTWEKVKKLENLLEI
jgi:tRNA wybutosine-synthesizing protein 3